jgi:hypothetical protein
MIMAMCPSQHPVANYLAHLRELVLVLRSLWRRQHGQISWIQPIRNQQ